MKRQNILIAACALAAVSLGGNIWLLWHRNEKSAPAVPAKAEPKLPSMDIDFSGTGLSDKAWKLTGDPAPGISLDKPFEGFKIESTGSTEPGESTEPSEPIEFHPNATLDKALLVPPPK